MTWSARSPLKQRRGRGGRAVAPHMLFLGPPGTGKTTVARLIGQIFRSLGLLVKGHKHEVGRVDLVAGYIGQTAIKTTEQIEEALDGVLFIDEAYSLSVASVGGASNDFGQEAIDTLVQQMENLRGRIAVIAAGLPGTDGGVPRHQPRTGVPLHRAGGLPRLLRRRTRGDPAGDGGQEEYRITPEAEKKALAWFEAERRAKPGSFGNGRAARGLLESMEARLGNRMTAVPDADDTELSTFRAEDVPDARLVTAGPPRARCAAWRPGPPQACAECGWTLRTARRPGPVTEQLRADFDRRLGAGPPAVRRPRRGSGQRRS